MENAFNVIPCRTFHGIDKPCIAFNNDFHNPQPPKTPLSQVLPNKLTDTHPFLLDDPVQSSLLIQMFLSEIHTPSEYNPTGLETRCDIPTALDLQEEAEPESDYVTQLHSSSGVSSTVVPGSHSLECIHKSIHKTNTTVTSTISPVNHLQNPFDDPFFSNFTDSLLEAFVTYPPFSCHMDPQSPSSTLPSVSTSTDPVSLPSPLILVDVQTVVSSSLCDDKMADQRMLDLSDCVSLLTDVSPSTPSPISSSCQSLLSSPSSFTSSTSSKCDLFLSMPSSPSSHTSFISSKSDLPTPSSPNDTHPNLLRSTTQSSRKKKSGEGSSEESIPVKLCRVSSNPSLSTTYAADGPSSRIKKKKSRRDKNNVASQISRAKRKQHHKDLLKRVEELEPANEELRKKIENLETETEALRKLLLQKLAQH